MNSTHRANLSQTITGTMNGLTKKYLMEELDLPESRADRTLHLEEKRKKGSISKTEFFELLANVAVRKEQKANPKVNNFGCKPHYGLQHLDGSTSINDLVRLQFDTVEDKNDVIEVSNKAQDEGKIFVSRGVIMFHADDVTIPEDSENPQSDFEITPQRASDGEEPPSDDEEAQPVNMDSVFAAA